VISTLGNQIMLKIKKSTLAQSHASVYGFRENEMPHRASRTSEETLRKEARRGTALDRDQTA
jgi:hypothetical protein